MLGPVTLAGVVPKLSASPGRIRWTGRDTGANTSSVLQRELGLSAADVEALAEAGIVAGTGILDKPNNR